MEKGPSFRLESFKPKLRKGRLISRGNKVIFESESPFNQIILPLEMADVISLCSGKFTVREIVEKIYAKQKNVAFKSVCTTVLNLKKQGFLENGNDLEDPDFGIFKRNRTQWLKKLLLPSYSFNLVKRIVYDKSMPILFFLLCISMLSTVVSILTHLNIEIIYSPFLWVKGSFLKGFLYLFVSTSILISSKTFFKFILLLIRTGRVYNTQLEITFFGVYFKIDYEGSHLIDRINERCLYHLSASLSYLSIGFILSTSPIFSDFSDQLILVSVFLSLWDLNPFYKSEMCEFFNSTDIFDKNNPWYLVQGGYLPQSQRSDTEKMFSDLEVKNIYQYTWALFSIMFFLKNTVETFPYVHYVFSSKSAVTEKIAAGYSLYLLILISLFSFSSIFRVLSKNTFSHLNRIFRNLSTKFKRIRSHQISKDELIQNLSSIPILNWFTDEELNTLLEQSEVLMFDNEMILFEEGDFADSLFVLVDGSIRLFKNVIGSKKRKKISTLTACSVFGEHCILDETRRLATAVSKERSTVIKIPREVLMERLNFSKYKIDVNSFRTAVMVDQFFHSAPIFSNLNSHVIQLILSRGLVEELEKPTVIFEQGDHPDNFYLILRGSVDVFINQRKVNQIPQGGFFGEIGVIASITRTATIVASAQTVLLKIDHESMWEILTQDLELALMIETVGEIRFRQDIEFYPDELKAS